MVDRRRHSRPLSPFLAVALVVGLIVLTQLIATFAAGVVARRELGSSAREQLVLAAASTEERVNQLLAPAGAVIDSRASRSRSVADGDDLATFARNAYFDISTHPSLDAVHVYASDTQRATLRRFSGGYYLFVANGPGDATVFTYDPDLEVLSSGVADTTGYADAVPRWLTDLAAGQPGERTWSLRPEPEQGNPGPLVAAEVTEAGGFDRLLIAVEIRGGSLATTLRSAGAGEGIEAYFLAGDRRVIASSEPIGLREGGPPTADEIGLGLPLFASSDGVGVIGEAGGFVEHERPVAMDAGLDWTLHLRGSSDVLAPSTAGLRDTLNAYVSAVVIVAVIAVIGLFSLRRPLSDVYRRASTDSLTTLANRHELYLGGQAVLERAAVEGRDTLVAMIDLDHFKDINDSEGHLAGDDVLRMVGLALAEAAGDADMVARYGGDEFTVVHPLSDGEQPGPWLDGLVARVREQVARERRPLSPVDMSAGFVVVGPGEQRLEDVLDSADASMISSKRSRRGEANPTPS